MYLFPFVLACFLSLNMLVMTYDGYWGVKQIL